MLGRYKTEVARVADPVARAMVGLRLRPNQLSFLGLVSSVIAAVLVAADQRRAGALFDLLIPAIWVLALGANATAVHRIIHTWRATRGVLR